MVGLAPTISETGMLVMRVSGANPRMTPTLRCARDDARI